MSSEYHSVRKSSSEASAYAAPAASACSRQLGAGVHHDAGRAEAGQHLGQERVGDASWTRRVSAALQTLGRWALALTTMRSATSRSAAAST